MEKQKYIKTRKELFDRFIITGKIQEYIDSLRDFLVRGDGKYLCADNRAFCRQDFDEEITPRLYRRQLVEFGEIFITDLADEECETSRVYCIVESVGGREFHVVQIICPMSDIKDSKPGEWLVPNL